MAALRGSGRDVNTDERTAVGHALITGSSYEVLRLIYPAAYPVHEPTGAGAGQPHLHYFLSILRLVLVLEAKSHPVLAPAWPCCAEQSAWARGPAAGQPLPLLHALGPRAERTWLSS